MKIGLGLYIFLTVYKIWLPRYAARKPRTLGSLFLRVGQAFAILIQLRGCWKMANFPHLLPRVYITRFRAGSELLEVETTGIFSLLPPFHAVLEIRQLLSSGGLSEHVQVLMRQRRWKSLLLRFLFPSVFLFFPRRFSHLSFPFLPP